MKNPSAPKVLTGVQSQQTGFAAYCMTLGKTWPIISVQEIGITIPYPNHNTLHGVLIKAVRCCTFSLIIADQSNNLSCANIF
jgi:hypothetical protein